MYPFTKCTLNLLSKINRKPKFTCSFFAAFSSFSRRRTSRRNSSKRDSLSLILSIFLNLSSFEHLLENSLNVDFPLRPASSNSFRNSSFFSFSLFLFSRLSSSARSFTYLSNTCFRSFEVRSKYLGSKTIFDSSFSHELKADTCKIIFSINF